jgi:uncharacterized protein (TIGR02246 family)
MTRLYRRRGLSGLAAWTGAGLMLVSLGGRIASLASHALIGVLFANMALGQAASLPAAAASEESAILKASETYRKAVLEADAVGVAALYRDDAIEMPPLQKAIVGRPAIEQFYRGMFGGPSKVTDFTFTHTETTAEGDLGYDVGTYQRTMSRGPSGPMKAAGAYLVILKRTAGVWKVAYLTYTCDCPPAGMPAPTGR